MPGTGGARVRLCVSFPTQPSWTLSFSLPGLSPFDFGISSSRNTDLFTWLIQDGSESNPGQPLSIPVPGSLCLTSGSHLNTCITASVELSTDWVISPGALGGWERCSVFIFLRDLRYWELLGIIWLRIRYSRYSNFYFQNIFRICLCLVLFFNHQSTYIRIIHICQYSIHLYTYTSTYSFTQELWQQNNSHM